MVAVTSLTYRMVYAKFAIVNGGLEIVDRPMFEHIARLVNEHERIIRNFPDIPFRVSKQEIAAAKRRFGERRKIVGGEREDAESLFHRMFVE